MVPTANIVYCLVDTFITRPLTHLGKASEKLREHFQGVKGGSARKYHLQAVQMAETFINVMSKKQKITQTTLFGKINS